MLHNTATFHEYSVVFLSQLIFELNRDTFSIDDHIFEEGDLGERVYFITKGNIILVHKKTKTYIKELSIDNFLGEYSFYTEKPYTCTARSKNFTEVLTLTRPIFLETIDQFPEEVNTYFEIKRQIMEENDLSSVGVVCYVCGVLGHMSIHCDNFEKIKGNL